MIVSDFDNYVKTDKQLNLLAEINRALNDVAKKLSFLENDGVFVEVCAAGGCVRDSVLQADPTIKDFDFYVTLNPMNSASYGKKILDGNSLAIGEYYERLFVDLYKNNKNLNFAKKFIKKYDNKSDYPDNDIHAIFEVWSDSDKYPIELIFSVLPIRKTVFDNFDFDICRIYMIDILHALSLLLPLTRKGWGFLLPDGYAQPREQVLPH